MSENLVELPIYYFGAPNKKGPLFNAKIYVGVPDLDPHVLANRYNIIFRNESGVDTPISPSEQPVRTSSGGYPTYNGQIGQVLVDGNYSIAVDNAQDVQQYYWPNYFKGEPLVVGDDHSLLANKNASGQHDGIFSRSFKTVADLIAGISADGTVISMADIVGSKVNWRGYYAESDGGSNWGIVKQGAHTEDGGSIFSIDANTYIEANLKGEILVDKFGAGDESVVADSILNLKAANDYAVANRNMPLKFSGKTYAISETFPFKTNMRYVGLGAKALNRSPNSTVVRGPALKWIGAAPTVSMVDNTRADNTAAWGVIDSSLSFNTDHYILEYTANTQYLYRATPNLDDGKTYRVYFSLKDGTKQNVSVTARMGSNTIGDNSVLNETFTTTPFWEEKSLAFVAGADTAFLSLFSTMTSAGNYEIADIRVIEIKSITSEYNCQHLVVENLSLLGDFSYDDNSVLCGIDMESFDNIQNTRRNSYANINIDSCYMGVGISERIKDSGNIDGYKFERMDIENCHTCVSTYSAFTAYSSFTSIHLSYFKCGFNLKRASWIDFKDMAGANILGEFGIPETQPSSLFRITANSGVINMSGCESENAPAGQLYSSQITFEGSDTKLSPTNIRGCDFGNNIELNIQHPTLNIGGNWFHTQSELNINVSGAIINLTEQNLNLVINENAGAALINNPFIVTYEPQVKNSWATPELTAGSGASFQLAYPNALLGDYVMVSCENRDMSGVILSGIVSSAENVRITAFNPLAATQPAATTDLSIQLIKSRA